MSERKLKDVMAFIKYYLFGIIDQPGLSQAGSARAKGSEIEA
jgi:hypothetical protein